MSLLLLLSLLVIAFFSSLAWQQFLRTINVPRGSSLFKKTNGNTEAMCKICSKLTIKIPKRCYWSRLVSLLSFTHCSSVSIVDYEHLNTGWNTDKFMPDWCTTVGFYNLKWYIWEYEFGGFIIGSWNITHCFRFSYDFLAISVRLGRAIPKHLQPEWREKFICVEG